MTSPKISEDINALEATIKTLKTQVANLKLRFKDIKYLEQENKKLKFKKSKKRSSDDKGVNKSPNNNNGFKKPLLITKELYKFFADELPFILRERINIYPDDLEKDKAEKEKNIRLNEELALKLRELEDQSTPPKLSRTDIARLFSRYVHYHGLRDPKVKKSILLDRNAKGKLLSSLLKGFDPSKNILTHINVQKYISHHFLPDAIAEAVVASSETSEPVVVPTKVLPVVTEAPESNSAGSARRKLVRRKL